jgi:hypothetical protein
MLPQLLPSLPHSGRVWETSRSMKSPSPSTYEYWMKIFKLSPSLKMELHWELRGPSRNLQNPTQMLSCDGMNNQSVPLREPSISHTNALIRWDEHSTPSSCKHWFFIR